MADELSQIQVILSSVYAHYSSLCVLTKAATTEQCLRLNNLCCKILVATNTDIFSTLANYNPVHISQRTVKLANDLTVEQLNYHGVTLKQVLTTLGSRSSNLMTRSDIAVFFPLGNSSVLQIQGTLIHSTMGKHVIPIRSKSELTETSYRCPISESKTVGTAYDSSIIADAQMFVSMLGDEHNEEMKESSNQTETITNISCDNSLLQEAANFSSEELFSSVTTKDGSVIVISSGSFATSQPEKSSCKQNSLPATLESTTALTNGQTTVPVDVTMATVASSTDGEKKQIEVESENSSILLRQRGQSIDLISTTDTSSSDDELSGDSSDDEEFLSNKELKRKKPSYKDAPSRKRIGFLNSKVPQKLQWSRKTAGNYRRRHKAKRQRCHRRKNIRIRCSMLYSPKMAECFTKHYVLNKYNETETRQLASRVFRCSKTPVTVSSTHHPTVTKLSHGLHSAVVLLDKLLNSHRCKVMYHDLLTHYCPVLNHHGNDPTTRLQSLVIQCLSHDQVLGFLKSVLKRLVPLEFWGSKYNRSVFYRHLRTFVQLRRRETMSVNQLLVGIKLSHCDWLKPRPRVHKGKLHPPQTHLFERFIYWLMNSVLISTIKAFFYVTEHSEHPNCLYYYRKRVWSDIQQLAVHMIPYQRISIEEVQHLLHFNQSLGISKLRFLPKTSGVRPIVNLRSKLKCRGNSSLSSINEQLSNVFHILNYEKSVRPEIAGSSCFGLHEVFSKLKAFTTEQKMVNTQTEGPLLFARVDISGCFDSMQSDKALQIVTSTVLSKPSYIVRCFAKLYIFREKVQRSFSKAATANAKNLSFFKFAKHLAKNNPRCIIVDQGLSIEITKEKVKSLLQKHLFGNIVKLGKDYFQQCQGISHGAQLSTLLCGFYYADMEKHFLPKINPSKGLLMRYVDDFLLITREEGVAREFLTTMQRGVASYNCIINPAKTVANFTLGNENGGEEIKYLSDIEWIKWCGLLLNTRSLDVMADYSLYIGRNIRDNMTIGLHSRHYTYLRQFSRRAIRLKCMPVLLDSQVVNDKTAVINIYQGFLVASYKYVAMILSMPNGNKMAYPLKLGGFTRKDFVYFFKTAIQMYSYFWQLALSKGVKNPLVTKRVCIWLGCYALRTVLTQHKPHKMFFLISLLSKYIQTLSIELGVYVLRKLASAHKKARSGNIHTIKL